MRSKVCRILLITDRESDRRLIDNLCNSVSIYQLELDWIAEIETIDWNIASDRYDLYLIDFACFRAEIVNNIFPAIALIDNPEEIQIVLDAGVADYLEKGELTSRDFARSIRLTLQNALLQRELRSCQEDRIKLISLQQRLERTVQERTADLAKTNRELRREIEVRQKVETSLRESESQFRQLAENIESVFWIVTSDFKQLLYVSPMYEKILGHSCDRLQHNPLSWLEVVHAEDREMVGEAFDLILAAECSQKELAIEYRIVKPDDTIHWLSSRIFPILDSEGNIYRLAGIFEAITERKQTEERLRLSKERSTTLKALESQLNQKTKEISSIIVDFFDILFILNGEGIILDYKAKEDADLYVPKEEFIGKSFVEILPAPVAEQNWQAVKQAIETNTLVSIEYSLPIENRTQYYEARILPFQSNELISVVRNISDRKQAEIALQNSEERFRSIFEQAAVGIARMNLSGEFIQVNERFCEIAGYAESELLGCTFAKIAAPEDLELCQNNVESILRGERKTCSMQKRFVRKDRQVRWVNSSVSVVLDCQGVPQCLLVVLQDIQEQKQVESKLEYRLKLETALVRISQELALEEDPDIDKILETMGIAVGASRAYLVRFFDRTRASLIHEWCESETPSDRDKFQNVDLSVFPWWMENIRNNDPILIVDVDRLPLKASAEKQHLKSVGVNSVLVIPIYDRSGQVWGNIGFDTSGNNCKQWSTEDAKILGIVAKMLSSYYSRAFALERLQASEALYEGIFNYSAEAIFLVNVLPEGRFVYETVNPTYQQLTGLSLEDCLGKTPAEIFSSEIAAREEELYRDCIEFAETIECEQIMELPLGKKIWRTNLVPITDGTKKIIKLQGSARDITKEKIQDQQQQIQFKYQNLLLCLTLKIRQSLQLQDILETAVTELQKTLDVERVLFLRLFADRSGKVVNEAVAPSVPKMLNEGRVEEFCLQQELLSQNPEELYQFCSDVSRENFPLDRQKFLQQYQIKAYVMLPILVANLELEAEIIKDSSLSSPSFDRERTMWGILCVHQCSEPREWQPEEIGLLCQFIAQLSIAIYQAELLKQQNIQRQKLARSNAELEQFAYIVSHDLQEPLHTISSYAKFLQKRDLSLPNAKADKFIGYIIDGAQRMQTLINDLLEYSRLENENKPFVFADCQVLFDRAIANLKSTIIKQQATVSASKLPTIKGDTEQIVQLFQNLISNAIKYRSKEPPIVRVSAQHREGFWLFSIEDNGIGIDPQYSKRIFQIFQRLHAEAEYPGTGIGLAICQKIVQRHGGCIWVESKLERGSTFYFTIQD